ncbi:hypothetical protein PV10_06874 [Exophiala mesophila]|uniref:Dol-P-Glc:Glc(2)Man(9)GlcNAc(2)-PP-Dol alpha-1,2-glucosyltransferase n=1 Tax=Exophiala mesophila TaxID=212818 RepID=A0A0D1ZRU9_EXOME|nr:uncharacterized protein PV10_06874 [Exophiala mesophila]KIV89478.1 hypothetical protein PV10_06874 [Exophiala mesophila]
MLGYFKSPEFQRVVLLLGMTLTHSTWRKLINQEIPQPYLDEVFHVPQSQAFYTGDWRTWDSKITTPPGLYVFAYYINSFRNYMDPTMDMAPPDEWRYINAVLYYLLLIALYVLAAVGTRSVQADRVLQREFAIVMFPLLFFFSGLFYTDLLGVFAVVVTQVVWTAASGISRQNGNRWPRHILMLLHVLLGLLALSARQTNIFWVSIYLAGLQVVETIKDRTGVDKIHDPPIAQASVQDFFTTTMSLARSAAPIIPQILVDIWPQLVLLASFAGFVFWNGGVVLGDKTNHIATIHLSQMLYIWPLIVFFSWPVMLPLFTDVSSLRRRLPRFTTIVAFTVLGLLVVHFNTLVHPFTLADNRHYTFYVFRMLRRHWIIKYVTVPIYVACGWLVIAALGGPPEPEPDKKTIRILHSIDTASVSTTLVWLTATALSLVTAPLVEPRYFIVPWLLWRLSVPEYVAKSALQRKIEELDSNGDPKHAADPTWIGGLLRFLAGASPYLELTCNPKQKRMVSIITNPTIPLINMLQRMARGMLTAACSVSSAMSHAAD